MAMSLFSLPDIALKEIFSYLSYDEVAHFRVVNRDFNEIGKEVLNKGLLRIEKFHLACLKDVKRQLPRRESERRSHPLARHVDVLMAIETRISMLSMTYTKYIDAGVACFIPGKVLDEMFNVLRIVKRSECPPRPHEILQELRDISSMAMEHFDDKIAPQLKQKMSPGNSATGLLLVKQSGSRRHSYILRHSGSPCSMMTVRSAQPQQNDVENLIDFKASLKTAKHSSQLVMKELGSLKSKVRRQSRHIAYQRSKIAENATKIAEQNTQLAELRKLVEECSQKMTHINVQPSTSSSQPGTSKQSSSRKRSATTSEPSKKKKQKSSKVI